MDVFLQQEIPPEYTGDITQQPNVTADSYHRYKEDVAMAATLKLQVYRFSVSWPRVLPEGDTSKINQDGVNYYNNLINELIKNNIQPMITMNHFDYPLATLKKTGGWANKAIVPAFREYADFLFKTFGDRVRLWTTINEANYYCMNFALLPVPGLYTPQVGDDYKCVHHTILAHMEAYRVYEEKYRKTQGGKIGAAALTLWCRPNSTAYEDIQAAERGNLFALGSIYHPVVYGDYPTALKERRVAHYSALEGRSSSRLPSFTDEERARLKGSADFLCFNAYMGTTVADGTKQPRPAGGGTIQSDRDAAEVASDTRPGHFGDLFMRANPWVLRDAPLWIRDNYNNTPLFITENGWADERGKADPKSDPLDDEPRVGYHSVYLQELIRVATEENVNVMGYLVWSLIDAFEWTAGYTRKFGLVHVDYENGSLNRTIKKSAWFFQELGTNRRVPKVPFTFVPGSSTGAGSKAIPMHYAMPFLFVFGLSCLHGLEINI
ncbi:lactase/phlorizin hydrolase-like [Frankliniella occidentalis]|uniref:Lactase/phlorizin hydrolase-like n=1 Tax=Frankliniella occidentalis TaxID=133901 RepID=A0A9C6U235_FRAOC|nr:lactase/phlorizin hydrolase-like [Frankliniella occidentalis]